MFEIEIPRFKNLRLDVLVVDFNGTIALDGILLPGVLERLKALADTFEIHVITADTFGSVTKQAAALAQVKILESDDHREEKRSFVEKLGITRVAAIGNGRNDVGMIELAAVGIAICGNEGASGEAMRVADVVCNDIKDALDLFLFPKRLLASLRG